MDTRVACMRPSFSSIKVRHDSRLYHAIEGSVWSEETVPRLHTWSGKNGHPHPSHFKCSFSAPRDGDAATKEPISICDVPFMDEGYQRQTGLVSEMFPIDGQPNAGLVLGPMYLVINATGNQRGWQEFDGEEIDIKTENMLTDSSEWVTLQTYVGGLPIGIRMTLCSFAPQVQDLNITATRSQGAAEVTTRWLDSSNMYDTEDIRTQLGVTTHLKSNVDRGIFKLAKKDSWLIPHVWYNDNNSSLLVAKTPPVDPIAIRNSAFTGLPGAAMDDSTVEMNLPDDSGFKYSTADDHIDIRAVTLRRLHAAVFTATIKNTGSAAWAIQALITTLFSMSYYDFITQFSVSAPAELEVKLTATRPMSFRFFIIVLIIIAVHLSVMIFITAWFLQHA
ncbi:hypothetical protein FOIG_16688 [Fusarium odoratissimum NRRL 54006]|uniref:Uncharacterized protein n=1 Tax=Fusarium odoratissimum (strain NRRL 54006) TaxID=1089451 RepID=X0J1A7_FUSO5|nr:uncharacterized protein FOIG_16688 [Fusarium odoratissimum NRRL 54006]EXL90035.1 hypothetical protein FOIG_16688 [Fusarium odoratissimum NRRL 54006]